LSSESKPLAGRELVDAVVERMVDSKAENIAAYSVENLATMCDWYIICSGTAPVHARAIAQAVAQTLKQRGTYPVFQEGMEGGRWAVIDFTDVVVHVMIPEIREYYEIEELWSQGTRLTDQELGITSSGI